ncbi:hypothetical protein IQ07DRAFT_662175 [Pyrenochaeta sp. DS3sAY3a]|nr:hypothetical protein IQ07DRAFT_662175 [Pyrenochaeta sp. DS3sAY3a]
MTTCGDFVGSCGRAPSLKPEGRDSLINHYTGYSVKIRVAAVCESYDGGGNRSRYFIILNTLLCLVMSQLPAALVHKGFWTNVDKGPVMGRTFTTDTQTGNICIALLAILTTLGVHRLWSLIIFASHQLRAAGKPADAFFRQQQVLLRTLPTPSSLLTDWIKLWWVWRKAENAVLRSIVFILLGIVFSAGTILAGTFTALAVSTRDIQILVDSRHCAPWSPDSIKDATVDKMIPYISYIGMTQQMSKAYAAQCYGNYDAVPERCKGFVQPNISFQQQRVECPFAPAFCKNFSQPGIQLDSGVIDLHDELGLNLLPAERVSVRKRTTCAVLDVENRTSTVDGDAIVAGVRKLKPNEEFITLQLGQSLSEKPENYTFALSTFVKNFSASYEVSTTDNYMTKSIAGSSFEPPPEMQSTDADVVMINIAKNAIPYRQEVDDPVFAAHVPHDDGQNETLFISDFPFSTLGCQIQKYQFCHAYANGAEEFCSKLEGLPNWTKDFSAESYPNASSLQIAIMQDIGHALLNTDIQIASSTLKASGLQENFGIITELPDDQWIKEVVGWESTLWASLQVELAEYAIGRAYRSPGVAAFVKTNLTSGEKAFCGKQKMGNPGGFVNINVFAVFFIGVTSLLVTLLDLVFLRLIIMPRGSPQMSRWIQEGIFQLQRRAYEAHGEGTWFHLEKEVPMTDIGLKLEELPLESSPVKESLGKEFSKGVESGNA